MKKLITFLTAIILVLTLAACGQSENKMTGTYEIDYVEMDGVKYTVAEIEAMGDDSMSNSLLVIKDGGKAYVSDNVSGNLVDWEATRTGIVIGEQECTIVDGLICLEYDENKIYFKKISDDQEIKKSVIEESDISDIEEENSEIVVETAVTVSQTSEISEVVEKDVEETIGELTSVYEGIVAELGTYDEYKNNIDKVAAFYTKSVEDVKALCIRLCEYSIDYVEQVLSSDKTCDEKYDDMELLYDCIYEDAGDEIYDEIYDGILDDIYDDFYDGILDDAYDEVSYEEWSKYRSDEYECWSDCRSDVYDVWSDFRSDVYDLGSDVRSELWDDDVERAEKKLQDFREDVEKLKNGNIQNTVVVETDETIEEIDDSVALVDGMRPEFKDAMDSYEAFYDEYCDIMKKYLENPTDLALLSEYTDLATKATEMEETFVAWENNDLNSAELGYYLEVTNRITQKLLEIA